MIMVGMLSMAICHCFARVSSPAASAAAGRRRSDSAAAGMLAPDHVARFGGELFGRHLIAVEMAGMLLLAALVGAAAIVGHEWYGKANGSPPDSNCNIQLDQLRTELEPPAPTELALLENYLFVGAMLFGIGLVGFLSRRNMIVMFLSAEMMLQGVSREPGGLGPVPQRLRRPDAGDVHHCRGGLRGGRRVGLVADALRRGRPARHRRLAVAARGQPAAVPRRGRSPMSLSDRRETCPIAAGRRRGREVISQEKTEYTTRV